VIEIEPWFSDSRLSVDSLYVTQHGDTVQINTFKCYLTQFSLVANSGAKPTKWADSRLIDIETPKSTIMKMLTPKGSYTSLCFTLGVDSVDNVSGANAGDLDPAKGMYWAWNSGYIMAKLEGTSSACGTLHHAFEYHIGGYKAPYNAARHVVLAFPQPLIMSGTERKIILKADVAHWFSRDVNLRQLNSILVPGQKAAEMADRYSQMFSIISIE
jgi:hypothetical protein